MLRPITFADRGELGPAMKALPTDRMRGYVQALLEIGVNNHTKAALLAGYADSPNSNMLAVTAHRLAHDPRVQAAIQEEARKRMNASAIMAVSTLVNIADSPTTATKDRLRAIEMILNRTGLHAQTEHKTTVTHTVDEKSMLARIKTLATGLGLDPRKLLGNAGIVVDAEFEEVSEGDTTGLEDLL